MTRIKLCITLALVLTTMMSTASHAATTSKVHAAETSSVKEIELISDDNPYGMIEDLKQRLTMSELELKKPRIPQPVQEALKENPEITAAMDKTGWDKAILKGIGDCQLKQSGTRSIIKMSDAKARDGLLLMALAMKTMIHCGDGNICFSLDKSVLATKPKRAVEEQ